jgi:hypothetical protein
MEAPLNTCYLVLYDKIRTMKFRAFSRFSNGIKTQEPTKSEKFPFQILY